LQDPRSRCLKILPGLKDPRILLEGDLYGFFNRQSVWRLR
jgi:hypothetical protein